MAAHHTNRPSNHPKRPLPAHARPSKPAPLSKRTNSYGAGKKAVHSTEEDFEDEEVMATSFLQFCTTCEKQIIVPSNSVLYCSESCRKKDTEKQFSFPFDQSPPPTPFSTFSNFSFDDFHFRDIVPPRSPTQPRSKRSSCAFSEMSSDDNTASGDEKSRTDSEASRYLRQFQSPAYSGETTVRPRRPRYNRASTSQVTFSAAPSLSHTPASSVSFSLPYTPSTRPLPRRTNPHSSSYGSRSIDLVTPWTHASTAPSSPPQYSLKAAPISRTSTSHIEGEILYEKSPIPSVSPANGSLGRLLASTPR
ncbi:hypothetical protein BU26DRAFT_329508 [Trematosphaeria pertusa]|uniref:Life-span regulatory factor-domain-containing protein n=1 Tax=Trematosphaeria pertusa TaxID=390896 RepID=A0A6A6ICC3_9PLEO|nr:uncharacterized protein BU26DRAFT_329508 [Trematosphaeria pertusa]KAF2248225.1 hypothetical protein BU26DRAFT_329508 [Trematosphaeria pertusa]